jgi:hypothetical protein
MNKHNDKNRKKQDGGNDNLSWNGGVERNG